ncbi:MAG: histidine triad nucleotide-binding protein [Symbiobacteriaceae bacterium]|nr:histidine triad nucleotide-binding protein [Symbiobacteriaceae bacterium]
MSTCLFCRIIAKELPATVFYEDENWLVIADINPQAPWHLLFISKEHIPSFQELTPRHSHLLANLVEVVHQVTVREGISSYRLINNVGVDAGQSVPHFHWHLLAGKELDDFLA